MSMSTICCVCHQEKSLHGWLDEFMAQYRILENGYCPQCFRQTMERLQAEASGPAQDSRQRPAEGLSDAGRVRQQG